MIPFDDRVATLRVLLHDPGAVLAEQLEAARRADASLRPVDDDMLLGALTERFYRPLLITFPCVSRALLALCYWNQIVRPVVRDLAREDDQ